MNEETFERKNLFCIISLEKSGEYAIHEILTNSAWNENPYPERYAVVPDDLVPEIVETCGFCDIELNEDGTEIVSFTAREIPEIPEPDPEPTPWDEMAEAIHEGVNDI